MQRSSRARSIAVVAAFCAGVACGGFVCRSTGPDAIGNAGAAGGPSVGSPGGLERSGVSGGAVVSRPHARAVGGGELGSSPAPRADGGEPTSGAAADVLPPLIPVTVELRDASGAALDATWLRLTPSGDEPSFRFNGQSAARCTDESGCAAFTLRSHASYDLAVPVLGGEVVERVVPVERGQVIRMSLSRSVEVSLILPPGDPPVPEVLVDAVRSGEMDGRLGERRRFQRADPERVEVERVGARTVIGASEGVEYTVSLGCDCRSAPFFAVPGATVTVPACGGRVLSIDVAARHPQLMGALRFAVDGVPSMQRVERSRGTDFGSIRLCVPRHFGTVEWTGEGFLPGSASFDLERSRSLSVAAGEAQPIARVLPGAAVTFLSIPDFASHLDPNESARVVAFGLGDDGRDWHEVGSFGAEESRADLQVSRGTQVMFVVAGTAGSLPFYAGPTKIDAEQTTIARMEPGGFVAPLRGPRIGRAGVAVTLSRDDGNPLPHSDGAGVSVASVIDVRSGTVIGPLPPGPVTLEFRSLGQVVARTRVVVEAYATVPAEFDAAE